SGGPLGSSGDVTDLVLGTKWRAWHRDGLTLGGRLDVKMPSASRPRGFGTGNPDAFATVISTTTSGFWAKPCATRSTSGGLSLPRRGDRFPEAPPRCPPSSRSAGERS